MVLYGITLVPLAEELRDEDPTLLSSFYSDYVEFYRYVRRITVQLCLLMDRGMNRVQFPKLAKLLFIGDNPEDKEAVRRNFEQAGSNINYVDGSRYLRANLGPREELEEWVQPKVEAWDHGVRTIAKIANQYPQSAYAGLGVSIKLH